MKKVLAIVLAFAMLLPVLSVNVFAEEIELFSDPEGEDFLNETWGQWNNDQEKYTFAPNDFFGTGNFWGRKAANILNITVDKVKELANQGGVTFKYVFSGDPSGWWHDGASLTFDWSGPKAVVKVTDLGGGKYEGTASLDELVEAWEAAGKSIDQITALLIQVGYENFKLYSAEIITAPEEQGKVRIGDEYFDTLVEAVDAAQSGDTIYLLDNLEGAGIGIFAADGDVKDFTIDFGGFTYTCVGPAVGSTGTQSQAFHLEKGADYTPNVTFKNGTITAETGVGVKMLIQNYCNLTLTNMNLIGTTDTQYVLSNNFGNTVIDGNTSITATAGNVAFDVCYANGSYKDGVSVTVNTTGTITGIIELGTWNAAGAATGAPDINDYLENANLIINNVKLDGEIRNVVTGTYEPDPEVYSGPTELGLFVSTDMYAAPDATVTVTEPGTYTISKDFGSDGVDYSWIVIKEANSRGWEVGSTTIPTGTKVNITNIKINNTDVTFPDSASQIEYTVGNENKIEYAYYNMYAGGTVSTKPTEGNITSISVTIEIVENEKSEEEIAAELKDKLTETVAINGGVFGAGSGVEDYLPEGDYETDDDGNIVIGDVVDDEVDYSHIKLTGGCVYLNENYHAFIVNGRFLAGYHIDNGSGFCPLCRAEINTTPAE